MFRKTLVDLLGGLGIAVCALGFLVGTESTTVGSWGGGGAAPPAPPTPVPDCVNGRGAPAAVNCAVAPDGGCETKPAIATEGKNCDTTVTTCTCHTTAGRKCVCKT
jgi:hypothetical protein